jgi:hypothetical protein
MPTGVRSRVALFALVGVFLIPIGLSSLSGLTHVLTCQERTPTPFALDIPAHGVPTISSSETLAQGQSNQLCGGLTLDLGVQQRGPGRVRIVMPITNHTRYTWRGSVKLLLGHTSIPLNVGSIRPGQTHSAHVDVRLDPGTHNIDGSLLVGP